MVQNKAPGRYCGVENELWVGSNVRTRRGDIWAGGMKKDDRGPPRKLVRPHVPEAGDACIPSSRLDLPHETTPVDVSTPWIT
jgi:hypothetical protein